MRFWLWMWSAMGLGLQAVLGADTPRLRVLTTIAPLYSWTVNVAGDAAQVENLLPADVGPHTYSFRPRDLRRLGNAQILIANGLGLEQWLEKALDSSAPSLKVVRIGDALRPDWIHTVPTLDLPHEHSDSHDHDHGHEGDQPNPHVWLDPRLALRAVAEIARVLGEADPARAEIFQRNAAAYSTRLQALDAEIHGRLASLPRRRLVTFHDAFPYFTRRYELELVGVIEEVPNVDPSPRYLAKLLEVIRRDQVKAIFTEPQFNPRLARRLAADLGIACAELDVLETGRLAPDFYEQGMRRNTDTLVRTLGKP